MLAFCLLGTTGVFFVFDYVNEYFFSNGLLELKYEVVVFMLLQSIAISFIWVHPLLVALGKLQLNFHLTLAANAAYMLLLISLLKLLGMWALVIAIGFQFAIVVGGKFIFISSYLKNKRDVRETYDT